MGLSEYDKAIEEFEDIGKKPKIKMKIKVFTKIKSQN